jgi:hypothetical protein
VSDKYLEFLVGTIFGLMAVLAAIITLVVTVQPTACNAVSVAHQIIHGETK